MPGMLQKERNKAFSVMVAFCFCIDRVIPQLQLVAEEFLLE